MEAEVEAQQHEVRDESREGRHERKRPMMTSRDHNTRLQARMERVSVIFFGPGSLEGSPFCDQGCPRVRAFSRIFCIVLT